MSLRLYVSAAGGIVPESVGAGVGELPRSSFFVNWDYDDSQVMDEYLQFTWAYTAP